MRSGHVAELAQQRVSRGGGDDLFGRPRYLTARREQTG
jgi:hypothetical protein